ncbi:MAG: YrdB family protein [Marmoricola sp.]
MRAANLALKFILELAAIALLATWGARTSHGLVSVVLAIAAPAVMIVIWGRFAAPRAPGRLHARLRIPLELGVFATAGVLAYLSGLHAVAIVFGCVAAVNAVGLSLLGQWEA